MRVRQVRQYLTFHHRLFHWREEGERERKRWQCAVFEKGKGEGERVRANVRWQMEIMLPSEMSSEMVMTH